MKRIPDTVVLQRNGERILAGTPLFCGVQEHDLSAMLVCLQADFRSYEKNETILPAGSCANKIGVVMEGRVQVIEEDYYGNRSILNTAGSGQLFLEGFACAGVQEIPVSVIAAEASLICFLNTDQIFHNRSYCEFHYVLVENLLRIVAQKNVFMNRRLSSTMHKSTREKILSFLMDEKRRHGSSAFEISFDRQEMADYLGVERSAMSAELGKMQREGILKTVKNHFELPESKANGGALDES